MGKHRVRVGIVAVALVAVVATVVTVVVRHSQPQPQFRSLYVGTPAGVRLAVDLWLPPGTTDRDRLPTVLEGDRYWRAQAYRGGVTDNPNYWAVEPWLTRGYAYVFVDLQGTGASFGTLDAELGPAMVADIGTITNWVTAQPWSDGRIGLTGVSYSADVAMLALGLRNPHIVASAPVSYDFDPYEYLLRPGGIFVAPLVAGYATLLRILDGAAGTTCATSAETRQICAEVGIAGASPEPVQDQDGEALLRAARAQHDKNINLVDFARAAVFDDSTYGQQTWTETSVGDHLAAIEASHTPILTFAGWLDAATAQGVLSQFTSMSNTQENWIGPWSHGPCCSPGEGDIADPFKPFTPMTSAQHEQLANLVYAFFDRYVKEGKRPSSTRVLHYYTLNAGIWHTTTTWPVAGTKVRPLYLDVGHLLNKRRPPNSGSNTLRLNASAGTGDLDRWHANFTGGPDYPNRAAVDRKLLTYTSAPLQTATLVTGNPRVTLWVTGVKGASNGALYAYLEDVSPSGRVTYITEGELALADRAEVPARDNPSWRKLLVPRSYDRAQASPFPEGKAEPVTFDLIATSVLFHAGDRIRLTIAAADPSSFQLLPPDGEATYLIGYGAGTPSVLQLPVVGSCSVCGA